MPSIYISPQNKIGYSFLFSTILITTGVVLGLFNMSQYAEIIITPKIEEIDINFEVRVNDMSLEKNDQTSITGRIIESIQEAEETTKVTGTSIEEDFSQGKIILTNNTWNTVNFVASTRFASPSGLIFRALNKIRIPSKGETSVLVRADKTGKDYDIGPSDFTIPNLRNSFLKTNISAKSKTPMTGGFIETGTVFQKDIDEAINKLKEKTYSKGLNEIQEQLPNNNFTVIHKDKTIKQEVDAKALENKTEFNAIVKMSIGAVAFDEKELLDFATLLLKQKIPYGKKLAAYESSSLSYRLINYNPSEQWGILEVQLRGYSVINSSHPELQTTNFANLSAQKIKETLEQMDEIEEIKIKLWPPIITREIPSNVAKIKTNIKSINEQKK